MLTMVQFIRKGLQHMLYMVPSGAAASSGFLERHNRAAALKGKVITKFGLKESYARGSLNFFVC